MHLNMTKPAERDSIEPMLRRIAIVVMIVPCLISTRAAKRTYFGQNAFVYGNFYLMVCQLTVWMLFGVGSLYLLATFSTMVSLSPIPALGGLFVFPASFCRARLTPRLIPTFQHGRLMKLREVFVLLALSAGLRYDGFRHCRFPFKTRVFRARSRNHSYFWLAVLYSGITINQTRNM